MQRGVEAGGIERGVHATEVHERRIWKSRERQPAVQPQPAEEQERLQKARAVLTTAPDAVRLGRMRYLKGRVTLLTNNLERATAMLDGLSAWNPLDWGRRWELGKNIADLREQQEKAAALLTVHLPKDA